MMIEMRRAMKINLNGAVSCDCATMQKRSDNDVDRAAAAAVPAAPLAAFIVMLLSGIRP